MLGTFAEILRQLERKLKNRWSCGATNRVGTVAKTLTLVIAVYVLYLSMYSVLDLDNQDETSTRISGPAPQTNSQEIQISNTIMQEDQNKSPGELAVSIITRISKHFKRADITQDGFLDLKELSRFMNNEVVKHFSKAMRENFDHYFQTDANHNGLVQWEEYLSHFFTTKNITNVTADDVRSRTPKFHSLPHNIKVEVARIQAGWSEAATNNPDFLTVDEFLAFEHPEASPSRIISQVQDLIATFDLDGDGVIRENEFETTYKEAEGVDPIYKRDKRIIDTNGDSEITRVELMRYMDPRSMHHSEKDAAEFIAKVDSDKDGRLSLLELMRKANYVVKSKFYDADKNLHSTD